MAIRNFLFIQLLLIAELFSAGSARAGLAPWVMEYLERYRIPLRWENVEGPPVWVNGAEPRYNFHHGRHFVTLQPGEDVTVRVPARALIRVFNPDELPDQKVFRAFISRGNGLFLERPFSIGDDGHSLLVRSELKENGLFRLTVGSSTGIPVTVALFISRYDAPDDPAPYRHLLELTAPGAEVRSKPFGAGQEFHRLSAGRPSQIRLNGPLRLMLEHRLEFPGNERIRYTHYLIKGLLDARSFFSLSGSTMPDSRTLLRLDDSYPTVGYLRKSYLSIPEGEHILTLVADRDLVVRLLARDQPDYFFPEFNNPFPLENRQEIGDQNPFIPFARSREAEAELRQVETKTADMEEPAHRLWRNNRYPDGGLGAAMAMGQLADRYPGSPELDKEAARIEGAYTFYRDLFPQTGGQSLHQVFAGLVSPRLKGDDAQLLVIQENAFPAIMESMDRAYFSNVPVVDGKSPDGASLRYLLPGRRVSSELRILVAVTDSGGSFRVRIGDSPEIRCDVLPQLIQPAEAFELDPVSAVLNQSRARTGRYFPLGPKIDPFGRTGTVTYVAEVTLPLNSDAETVVIRPEKSNTKPLRVALQYRDSSPFTLSEPEFLRAKEQVGRKMSPYQIFTSMLAASASPAGDSTEVSEAGLAEIKAFLRPLIRFILARNIVFGSLVHPLPGGMDAVQLSAEDVSSVDKKIQQAKKAGQWVSVLENASALYHGTTGRKQVDAARLIINALEKSGEFYLAEMQLRGMLLYPKGGAGDQLAVLARSRLEQFYRNRNDLDGLANLYAACLSRHPTPELLGKLAAVLLEDGRYRLALSATVILSPDEQEPQSLLRSTLKAGWHRAFASAIEAVDNHEERNYWRGLLQESLEDSEGMRQYFAQAGPKGEKRLRLLEEAATIGEQLTHGDAGQRCQAVLAWERWQSGLPGPSSWRNEPWLVHDHAGGVFLYSEAQDMKTLMFRATADRPVRAGIWGPALVKFVLRPLHRQVTNESLNGWIMVRIDDELELIPIDNNRPVQQWVMPPAAQTAPGRAITYDRYIGPGFHELSISGKVLPLLVGLQVHRPELNNGLPPLARDVVATVLEGAEQKNEVPSTGRLQCMFGDCLAVLSGDPEMEPDYFPSSLFKAYRQLIDGGGENYFEASGDQWNCLQEHGDASTDEEQNQKAVTKLMAVGKWDQALEIAGEETAEQRFRLMSLLTYLAETRPGQVERYETRARGLVHNYPGDERLQPLMQRIEVRTQWEQIEQIEGGAGLRLLPTGSWQPENPSLRIRKALLTTRLDKEVVLVNNDPLVLSLENYGTSELEISWKLAEVSYLRPEPMDIMFQLDDHRRETITLAPEQPQRSLRLRIPAGRHRLVTAIVNRYSNQFLEVGFREIVPASNVPLKGTVWLPQIREKAYHVATRDEPLSASIQGPAWIRIDERRQDETYSNYRQIENGWQTIEIAPGNNQEEILVRLYRRVEKPVATDEGLSRTTIRTYPELPPPLLSVQTEGDPGGPVEFIDRYRLGRQEDGTWSASLSWNKRRDLEEDTINGQGESFLQLSGSYHRLYDSMPTYLRSSLLMRKRTSGGPTVGLTGDITRRFNQIPFTMHIEGEGWTQSPAAGETSFFDRNPSEWSARFQLSAYQDRSLSPKLKHQPGVSVFGRLMSLDDASMYSPGTVDQDIYTKYKSDHRSGIRFSEYLGYRPWLDTVLFSRASYTSNEDMNPFNPDNIRLSAGLAQLVGPIRYDFQYRYSHYFEDGDRSNGLDRNDLYFGLSWEYWFRDQSRVELGMKGQYRTDSGEFTGMAGFTWYFSTSRGMRDLRPQDNLFHSIQGSRASQLMNNRMTNAEIDH